MSYKRSIYHLQVTADKCNIQIYSKKSQIIDFCGKNLPCIIYPILRTKSCIYVVLIPISSRSILILPSHLRLSLPKGLFPVDLPVKILKVLLPSSILATSQSSSFNLPDYIRWEVQTIKFLIVKPSPDPILIPRGPKYSPQDPVFKYP